jgi:cysteine desulfurase family protein (TIGR01976 family)
VLDLKFIRNHFPALQSSWALMDNAGGSAPALAVIDRMRDHMARLPWQLGADYPASLEASKAVGEGRRSAAHLLSCETDEIQFGASSTQLVAQLARTLAGQWRRGDEIVVTDLDHEANIGPWIRVADQHGLKIREWRMNPETAALEMQGLEEVLSERTKLVAFTHCANVVGQIHDVSAFTKRIRAAGALSCVDGVAFAPHRRVDVQELGADVYFASLYKTYGPHLGVMFGRREVLKTTASENHFFVPHDSLPGRLEPGNPSYEAVSSVSGIVDYLLALDAHHDESSDPIQIGDDDARVRSAITRSFQRIAEQEQQLVSPLLEWLDQHPSVELIGTASPHSEHRVPTVTFTVKGFDAPEVVNELQRDKIATRHGHFYAWRAMDRLGLHERGGVVRASLLHYNTPDEVQALTSGLERVLSTARVNQG